MKNVKKYIKNLVIRQEFIGSRYGFVRPINPVITMPQRNRPLPRHRPNRPTQRTRAFVYGTTGDDDGEVNRAINRIINIVITRGYYE